MPFHFDLKTLPEVKEFPPERRVQVERLALFQAAWDWRTWLTLPFMIGLILLAGYLGPQEKGVEQMIWIGVAALVGVLFFLCTLLVRANHYAVRLATALKARQGDSPSSPVVQITESPPVVQRQLLPTWLRLAGIYGFLGGSLSLLLGITAGDKYLIYLGGLALIAGILAVTRCALCPACKNVNIGIGEKIVCCGSCGTSFGSTTR